MSADMGTRHNSESTSAPVTGLTADEPSPDSDQQSASTGVPQRTSLLRTLIRHPTSLIALVWLGLLVVVTVLAPLFAPYSPDDQDLTDTLSGPSAAHLLGTDNLGRDILSRLMFGGRATLIGVLLATLTALILGATIGLLAGYMRSRVDSGFSAVADILMSIPVLVILLSVAAVTSRNSTILMVTVGVLFSASVYRVFRAATLEVRQELYITAARTSGLGGLAILRRHIWPRLGSLLIIQAAIIASLALVIQVALGYLGIDVKPPEPSWGNLVASASQTISTSVWQLIPPAVVIALTVLAFSAISDVAQQSRTRRGRPVGLGGTVKLVEASAPPAGAASATPEVRPPEEMTNDVRGQLTLSLRDLSVSVPVSAGGYLKLVDGISLDVQPGEIVGLVGESGAGKSVTARAILGILVSGAQVSGSIRYKGTELLGLAESEFAAIRGSEIAFVGQDPMVSLSPSFRIGSQLAELVRMHRGVGRKEAASTAQELLKQVLISDPEHVARLYPHQVSGGMAQRVVIALALAGDPQVIVADEPTTALDVTVQMQILGLLKSLQSQRSLAMLIVTHDWGVVADVCDRAVVMYAGQVVEEAPVADLFDHPLHPYSDALRAADPHSQHVGGRLRVIEGQVPPPGTWPIGCRFASRCDHATELCRSEPVALTRNGAHRIRCIRVDEIGPRDGR
jgi:peptide/nickel transport system permease protein